MKFLRLGPQGAERPAVIYQDSAYDLSPITSDIDGEFLSSDGIETSRRGLAGGNLQQIENWRSMRIGAPVSRPAAVICIGMNYAAHALESGATPPTVPVVFFKHPNTVVGPFDDVPIPPGAEKVDWEVELAVVIGRRTSYLSDASEARAHIAGFTISNDVSERSYQLEQSGGQWSKGKSCESFNPLGPFLVPASDVAYDQLRLSSMVNGEPRQSSSTADLIFPVDFLVWHLSQFMVLEPGDIVNTGTPEGVALSGRFPYLKYGDRMTMSVEGLGEQTQRLVKTQHVTGVPE